MHNPRMLQYFRELPFDEPLPKLQAPPPRLSALQALECLLCSTLVVITVPLILHPIVSWFVEWMHR